MSEFDDFNADFNAESEDDTARNRRLFFWLIAGATVCATAGIAVCAGLVWLAVERIGEIPVLGDLASADLPPAVHETLGEKQAWARSAFAEPAPFVVDRRPIETLFRRVTEACRAEDDVAFQQLLDGERYWQCMKESGLIKSLTRGEDRYSPDDLLTMIEFPAPYTRMHVHAVTPGSSDNEAIAYVIAWENDWIVEMRWWLVKKGTSWRIFDWESLQVGNRFSRRHAAYYAEIAGIHDHDAAKTAILNADRAAEEGRLADAARELREAASVTVPPFFQAEHRLDVAFGWARAGLSLYEHREYRAASPQELQQSPGLLLGWAMSEHVIGNYEKCLELIEQYELAVGGGPNVDRTRGDALYALGRFEEAADCYVRLLPYADDDLMLLSDLARRLPANRIESVIKAIERHADPTTMALSIATTVSDRPKSLAALEKSLATRDFDSGVLDLIRGDRLRAEDSIDEAAVAYLAAWEGLPPPDFEGDHLPPATRSTAVTRIVTMYCEAGRVADAYDHSPDKGQAFEEIVSYDERFGLPPDELAQVAEMHLQDNPDDIAAIVHAAAEAQANGNFERAIDLALHAASIEADPSSGYRIVRILTETDQVEEAIAWVKRHPDDAWAFEGLAEHLNDNEDWSTVLDLAESMTPDESHRQTVALQRARALVGLGRYSDAEASLVATYNQLKEEWLRSILLDEWIGIAAAAGRTRESIAAQIGVDAYPDLIQSALAERDFQTAMRLERDWKRRSGTDVDLLPTTVSRLWLQKDFSAVVTAVRGAGITEAATGDSGTLVLDQYIRSLIRTGDPSGAMEAAHQAYETTADATPLAVAAIANRDWEYAREAAQLLDDYQRSALLTDEDAGPELRTAAAANFRKVLRREVTDLAGTTRGILLLRDPVEGNADDLASRLQAALGDRTSVRVHPIELDSTAGEQHFLIHDDQSHWIVTFGQDRYAPHFDYGSIEHESLALAFEEHAAWIAVDECAGSRGERSGTFSIVAAVAAMAAEVKPVAVELITDEGAYLAPWSDQLPATMRSENFVAATMEGAELWWLFRQPAESASEPEIPGHLLHELAVEFGHRNGGESFIVEGVLPLAHGRVPVRLQVERVVAYPYLIEAVGTLNSELPDGLAEAINLRPDDYITLGGPNLRAWSVRPVAQQAAPTDD